jgi:anti-sigma B factor antagonist
VVEVEKVQVKTGSPVISFAGELDMATAGAMHSALEPWTRAGGPVTVDLSEVSFMDCTGIHALLKAASALGDRGCIIVHGAHGSAKRVLDITGIDAEPNIHVIGCTVLAPAA